MSAPLQNITVDRPRRLAKRPCSPKSRGLLLSLVRDERSLEELYRVSHNLELREVRAAWKASYRSVRDALIAQELEMEQAQRAASEDEIVGSNDGIVLFPNSIV